MAENFIEAVNRVVRVSRRMLLETGREPSAEELAQRLAMPVEAVRKLMTIAGLPIELDTAVGCG